MKSPTTRKVRKVKQLVFKRRFVAHYEKGFVSAGHFSVEDALKSSLLKKGYVVSGLTSREVIQVTCNIARANIPLEERENLQKQIDGIPPTNTYHLKEKRVTKN
jgi:hypothetical protein